ncbi:MAG: hypothetical protein K0R59_1192 [Sphingobacterium sp.]|jgi:hypothetical protein|nr:hypothetical protein [Sphingobacterium sp.]
MKKNYYLSTILVLIVLVQSCKKNEYLDVSTNENQTILLKAGDKQKQGDAPFQTSLQKAEVKILGDVNYQIGLKTKADAVKVQPGDCKFQPSLQ